MKKLMVINGPNLNMLGIREKNIYGKVGYEELVERIEEYGEHNNCQITCLQSNHEGDLVDFMQKAYFEEYDGIVINPGAYTHTSIAIADACKAIAPLRVIEVHISNIDEREDFRKVSYLSLYCERQIKGEGLDGYFMAIDALLK